MTNTRILKDSLPKLNLLTGYERAAGRDCDQPEALDRALDEALRSRGIKYPEPKPDNGSAHK